MFVNANSQMYTKQPNQCEFTLSAFESVSGELDSPKHTLPPNTVCRYHFQGRRHEIVWITFTKYHSAVDQSIFEAPTECLPQLRIWDGKLRSNKNGEQIYLHKILLFFNIFFLDVGTNYNSLLIQMLY